MYVYGCSLFGGCGGPEKGRLVRVRLAYGLLGFDLAFLR